ncbi:MAG: purine-nucleoside phosphorylase [Pseudomonadota bacterium]
MNAESEVPVMPCEQTTAAAAYLRETLGDPVPGLILTLGSGLQSVVDTLEVRISVPYREVPGFPVPQVAGHAGRLSVGMLHGCDVVVLQGREHYYEHGNAGAMAVPLRALRQLGAERLLMTNAVGSADPAIGPGELVLIEDHINLTGANPLIGDTGGSSRFVDMTNAYDRDWRAALQAAAVAAGVPLAERVYACFSGPSFETPAEIRAARILGADTVGMSVAPETILARQCGLKVAAISVVTNFAAGVAVEPLGHEQTMRAAAAAAPRCASLLRTHLAGVAAGEAW